MRIIENRLELIKMLPDNSFVAEIGVRTAAFSNEILTHCPVRRLYLVDSWTRYPGYPDAIDCSQAEHEENFREAQRVASHHSGRGVIIRGFSERIAGNCSAVIPPLDAVYIDANHSYEYVFNDLLKWSRRLKPDGVLLGHDYIERNGMEVVAAVNDFCAKHGWRLTHVTSEDFPSFRLERIAAAKTNSRIVHQIWLGGSMPQRIKELCQTIDDKNPFPSFWHRIWTEAEFSEVGIDIHQFDHINRHPAGASGGLRLVLIERYGGIYLDCDVECIKPLDALLEYDAFASPQDERLCNAVFGAKPHHPWIQWQLKHCNDYIGFDPTFSVLLMDSAPRDGLTVLPRETFYPWLWTTDEHERHPTGKTLAIHQWDGSWKPEGT